jgi:hypothetical protein
VIAPSKSVFAFVGVYVKFFSPSIMHKLNFIFDTSNSRNDFPNAFGRPRFRVAFLDCNFGISNASFEFAFCIRDFFPIIMILLAKHGIAFKKDKFILSNCKMLLSNPQVYFSFDLIFGRCQNAFGKGNLKPSNWVLLSSFISTLICICC